jgi:AraC-like DNA-binding protein
MNQTINQNGLNITLQKLDYPYNGFVSHLFEVKGKPILGSQRIFSREGVEIIFNLADPIIIRSSINSSNSRLETGHIVGNRTGYFDFQPENHFHICGIRFTLNGFFSLTGIDQNEFGDSFYSIGSVLHNNTDSLFDQILSQNSFQKRFSILKNWIDDLYKRKKNSGQIIIPYLIKAIKSAQIQTIGELEKASGYSRKHLFQSFKKETGLSLKSYQRNNRFNFLLSKIIDNSNWLDIAFDLGFYDQSHLIKDVRYYTGLSPKQLMKSPFDPVGKVTGKKETKEYYNCPN